MKEDILDKYALQLLTDSDKIWLQKALKAEPGFQVELDLHLEIVKGIEMHTEKLFDAAFVELNALADQTLKNAIQEIDKELENEGFFEPVLMPISTTKIAEPIADEIENQEVVILPNSSKTTAKEPVKEIKEVVSENNISVSSTTPASTNISNKTEQADFDKLNTTPNQLPSWVKIVLAAMIILLLIFLVVSNL